MALTPEQELEYLRLKKRKALAQKASSQPPEAQAQNVDTDKQVSGNKFNLGKLAAEKRPLSNLFEKISGPVITYGSAMLAEPAAGLSGIIATDPLNYMGGGRDADAGTQTIKNVRQAMTIQPWLENQQEGINAVNKVLAPVAKAFGKAEETLGDIGNRYGGPMGGAIGASIPTALLMATGSPKVRKAINRVSKSQVNKWLRKSAPTVDELKEQAHLAYTALDDSGIVVPKNNFDNLKMQLNAIAAHEGAASGVTDKVLSALKKVDSYNGSQPMQNMETIRKIIKNAAMEPRTPDSRIAWRLIDKVDDFMDNITLGNDYKVARSLWHRAKKGETIEEVMTKAMDQASGFENGLRVQFRSILNSPKKRMGFSQIELDAMRKVVHGTTPSNLIKQLGKFGISFDQSSSMLLSSLGFGAATLSGSPRTGLALVGIGTAAREWAKIVTSRNARLASAISRSGNNAETIVREYLKSTPSKMRRERDLTALLIANDPSGLARLKPKTQFEKNAIFYADLIRAQEEKQKQEEMQRAANE